MENRRKHDLHLHPRRRPGAFTLLFWVTPLLWLALSVTGSAAAAQPLAGHVPLATKRLTPIGRLDPSRRLRLAIGLPLRNQPALEQLLQDLSNPASPGFRHYLTPAQFTAQFGPTTQDYEAVSAFAKARGLNVTVTHPNRLIVDVEGATGDIEKAFHVALRTYQHPTEARQFFAPDAEPSLDLAVPILHISGLDDYARPHPKLRPKPAVAAAKAAPNAGSAPDGAYAGGDFRAAYVPGTSLTGAGQSVGLLQFDGYYPSDITAYRTQFGLPNIPLVNIAVEGGVSTPGEGNAEVCLDIEMVSSMAPGVSAIYVYEAPNPSPWVDLLNRMATDNLAKQLSCSWGGGGPDPSSEAVFQEMAAQGQSFFNAAGDSDAFTGEVEFPADSPHITQVGGTTLTTSGPGGAYLSETVWNWGGGVGSSGGVSTTYAIPAYQQSVSMALNQGSTTMRNIPDVAMTGDNVYVGYNDGGAGAFGGTSCATPLWAAFTALANQQAAANSQPPIGFLNPTIYALSQTGAYASTLHDITTGNNFSPSSPSQFSAVTGYDLCTGWGTPAGAALITALTTPPDVLQISYPSFAASGAYGGPFLPSSQTYTLTNTGTSALTWSAANTQPWTTLSPVDGTLSPGASTTVTWSLNAASDILAPGSYSDTATFTDLGTSVGQGRGLSLSIVPEVAANFPLNTDPGWSRQGQWAFGPPTGGGGQEYGYPDPAGAATGTNVFGVNLSGDYSTTVGGPYYLTTGAINLSNYTGTQLRFKRWLNCYTEPWAYETIDVSADGVTWTNIWNTVGQIIADSSWKTVQYNISAIADGQASVYVRWGHQVGETGGQPCSGWNIDDIAILGTPKNTLALSLSPASVTKGATPITATLTLFPPPPATITVALASSAPVSATAPATVTVPAGQSTVTFPVAIADDTLLDGSQTVAIGASTSGYLSASATLVVNDNQSATLGVALPASAVKLTTGIVGTLTVSAPPALAVAVELSSSNPALALPPAMVTIPAGQTSVNFPLTIPNDGTIDGPQLVTITANVTHWTPGSAGITILDNTNITVTLPPAESQGAGVVTPGGQVALAGAVASPLAVSLVSSDTTVLSVPATVTIPAGQSSASFALTMVDDGLSHGTRQATVTASASGFLTGSAAMSVLNDYVDHFGLSSIASPQYVNEPFTLTITAYTASNAVVTGYVGTPTLTATGGLTVTPTTSFAFAGGVWTGSVTLSGSAAGVTLSVVSAAGASGISNAFAVVSADYNYPTNWPTFGNNPSHTGYQPLTLGSSAYAAGWSKTYPSSELNQAAISNGIVYVTPSQLDEAIYLSALDASTGNELWRYTFPPSYSINPPTVNMEKVYTQVGNGGSSGSGAALWCFNAATGQTEWSAPFGAQFESYYATTVVNTSAWMDGGSTGGLYGFNTANGSQLFFNSAVGQYDEWTPAYYNGGLYTWVAGTFRSHNPSTGAILWSLPLSTGYNLDSINTVPAIDQGRAFVIGTAGLYAVNLTTQKTDWSLSGSFTGTPAVANGVVYAMIESVNGANINAYNEQTGAFVGAYNTSGASIWYQPIVTNDSLIVASTTNTYIFNLQTYALKQTLSKGGLPSLANGVLYLAGYDGVLRTFYPGGMTTIAVTLPATAQEGEGPLTGTITLSAPQATASVIDLTVSDSNRVSVPTNVTIPANQTSVTFPLAILTDSLIFGVENVTVTAKAQNYLLYTGSAVIAIADDKSVALTLAAPSSAVEGTNFQATVSINATAASPVSVSLSSSNLGALLPPPTVTIPAGGTSATFDVWAVDDGLPAGNRVATLTAQVPGWTAGTASVTVVDSGNDLRPNWPTLGNGPAHTGYQPAILGTGAYQAGWSVTYPAVNDGLNQVAVGQGMVFVTPDEYYSGTYLSALDTSSGNELWRAQFVSSRAINPPTFSAGKVYVQRSTTTTPTDVALLLCIDAGSAVTAWTAPYADQGTTELAPPVANGGVWIDGGVYGGIYGFNTSNGSQRFFTSLPQYSQWTPSYYNGTVYSWSDSTFRAHDPNGGAILWSLLLGAGNYESTTAAAIDQGEAYVIGSAVTAGSSGLFAINLFSQSLAWSATGSFTGTPATAGGIVYAINGSNVNAYNGQTGALVGTYSTGDSSLYGQPIVTVDSLIVTSTKMYIFNLQSFALKQTISVGAASEYFSYASLANGVLYLAGGDGVLRTFFPSGIPSITVQLPGSATVGDPPAAGLVTLSAPQATDTVVALTVSDASAVTAPASVTVPANQTSAPFQLFITNNFAINAAEDVTVAAQAPASLRGGSAVILVKPYTAETVALSLPATVTKGGTATGTISLSESSPVPVTAALASSDPFHLTVPATVIVPSGASSATFTLTAPTNTLTEGTKSVNVTATMSGAASAAATIGVLDTNVHHYTVSSIGPTQIKGAPISVTFTACDINGVMIASYTGTPALSAAGPGGADAVSPVTTTAFSAGVWTGNITVNAFDSNVVLTVSDGNGHSGSSAPFNVTLGLLDHFGWSAISNPEATGVPFTVTITAQDVGNNTVSSFTGSVSLAGFSGTTSIPISPTTTGAFQGGAWTGNMTVTQIVGALTLQATDGAGHSGSSNAFNVSTTPILSVAPSAALSISGVVGGPFTPASVNYTLTNVGSAAMSWSAGSSASWLTFSSSSGTLAAGASVTVTVSVNANANALAVGSDLASLYIDNVTSGYGDLSQLVTLTVAAIDPVLVVSPAGGLAFSGVVGGPFAPASAAYTVSNTGNAPMSWTASPQSSWLTITPTSGTLAAGANATVTASVNANASTLAIGIFNGAVSFLNASNGAGNTNSNVGLTVTPAIPVLTALPPFTKGTSDAIAWTAVPGASSYTVQEAGSANFSSPLTTQTVTATSAVFSGLTNGASYYYRAQATGLSAIPTQTWTQTSQADFSGDVQTNVTNLASGDVILSSTPLTGIISDPSFEFGLNGWTSQTSSAMGVGLVTGSGYAPMPTNGTDCAYLFTYTGSSHNVGDYGSLTQSVNFTGASTLIFDAYLPPAYWGSSVSALLRIDGQTVWSATAAGVYLNQGVSVAYLGGGAHVLELRQVVTTAGSFGACYYLADNFRTYGPSSHLSAGTLVSPVITPSLLQQWGQLGFDTVTPSGTGLTVDVLDASGNLLAGNVAAGANLSAIPAVAANSAIMLRANLSTSSASSTPDLQDWSVTWQTAPATPISSPWSNPVSTTQDATPPILTVAAAASNLVTTHNSISLQGSAVDATSGVAAVTVNGQTAATTNGFASWSATVPLTSGANSILVTAADNAQPGGNSSSTSISATYVPSTQNDGLPDAWKIASGLDPASTSPSSGPLGDPYNCGLSNLLAYAFNCDPAAHPANPVQASIQVNPADGLSYLTLTYPCLIGAVDLSYTVEVSSDLVTWSSAPGAVQQIASVPTGDGVTDSVTARVMSPVGATGQIFVHVRVTSQ